MPLLAIDADEVLFPFQFELNAFYNRRYGTTYTLEDYLDCSIVKVWGCTTDEVNEVINAFLSSDLRHIEPVPHALAALTYLRHFYRLAVITARDGLLGRVTRHYLDHHFPGYFESVVSVGNKYTGRDYRPKSRAMAELGGSALVDDYHGNIWDCAAYPAVLFGEYPWNRGAGPLPPLAQPGRDWIETTTLLMKLHPQL